MKYYLLNILTFLLCSVSLDAQQRLSLYEEFSGENCGPCAAQNPLLWSKVSANPSKILLIEYQSPIPSAGSIYNLYTSAYQNRAPYYGVSFAPYGRLNGHFPSIQGLPPGNVSFLLQTDIDAEASLPSPFNISVSHVWNSTGDSVTVTVNITCVSNFAPSGAQLKLRTALIEHLIYNKPPGSNGETEFHNVVRNMYPDPNGISLSNSWTSGQTQALTIKGYVPSYVNKTEVDTRIACWIQNDNNKEVVQAGQSIAVPLLNDIALRASAIPQNFICTTGVADLHPFVVVKNTGLSTLITANIYFRLNGGSWQLQPWAGTLGSNDTAIVNLTIAGVGAGTSAIHVIDDSVGLPNGVVDINPVNNNAFTYAWVHDNAPQSLPTTSGFEGGWTTIPKWSLYDPNSNDYMWSIGKFSSNVGHGNSTYFAWYDNYLIPDGEANYIILPTPDLHPGAKALDFWVSYAPRDSRNDTLEVVYSTNCGQNWTTLWTKAGQDLATTAPVINPYTPPQQSHWQIKSVDISNVPNGSIIAFRGISDMGSSIFLDDVNLRTGTVTEVTNVNDQVLLKIYPNPANDYLRISTAGSLQEILDIEIVGISGAMFKSQARSVGNGSNEIVIATRDLPVGSYIVVVHSKQGIQRKYFSIIH